MTLLKAIAAILFASCLSSPSYAAYSGPPNAALDSLLNVTSTASGTLVRSYTGKYTLSASGVTNPVPGATAEYPLTDGAGTSVSDISGNNNTGTFGTGSAAPTWTTYGLKFNEGAAGTQTSEYFTTPLTTFKTVLLHACAYTAASGTSYFNQFPSFLGATASNSGISFLTLASYSPWSYAAAFFPGVYGMSSGTMRTSGSLNTPTTICAVVALTLDTSDHIYLNGIEDSYGTQGSSASIVTVSSGTYAVGATPGLANTGFTGNIDYAVFYNSVLTPAQILQVTNYINAAVAARPGFPNYSTKPTGTTPGNTIFCEGDSLTAAYTGTPWCNATYFTGLTNTYSFNYTGVVGLPAHDDQQFFTNKVAPYISAAGGRNLVPLWEGTNDGCSSLGYTAAGAWASLQSMAFQARALGAQPILTTMISRSGCATFKNALNTLERRNWRQAGFVALNDVAAIPALGADSAYSGSACFYSDGIHLNSSPSTCYNSMAGYQTIGSQFAKVINILDGSTIDSPTVVTATTYPLAIGDNYVLHTPTANATDTLPDCTGLTGRSHTITNGSGTYTITVTPTTQTITGSAAIAANATATFECELTSPTAGGNFWLRVQ